MGPVRFLIARHFGFCYGVENAIEIAYRSIAENPGKKIFLLSQMIHNPEVNKDLQARGIQYMMDTSGKQVIPFSDPDKNDVVIIPAFGTTLKIEEELEKRGVNIRKYDTTCPFVVRVWKKAAALGEKKYSVIVHGKHKHEETRATFSRSMIAAPSIVIADLEEAGSIGEFILGRISEQAFNERFSGRTSVGFDPGKDLVRIGVINQTTMLASETQAIADLLKKIMIEKYGAESINEHFADTRDTLCYATNENQGSTYALLNEKADIAIVVGGYNSSNTSHIVELCEKKFPTYFISSADELISKESIEHFDIHQQIKKLENKFIPENIPVTVILTSGASCPDSTVDDVLQKILSFFPGAKKTEDVMNELTNSFS